MLAPQELAIMKLVPPLSVILCEALLERRRIT
jgi:hypothetical protein